MSQCARSRLAKHIYISILAISQCYGHATECYYNPEVDQRGLSINTDGVYSGGGVCLNCTVRSSPFTSHQIETFFSTFFFFPSAVMLLFSSLARRILRQVSIATNAFRIIIGRTV